MSKIRGIFPIFLVTGFGIINGIYVFGPEFKGQRDERESLTARKADHVKELAEDSLAEAVRKAEVAASGTIATEDALRPIESEKPSLWKTLSFWSASAQNEKTPSKVEAQPKDDDKPGKVA